MLTQDVAGIRRLAEWLIELGTDRLSAVCASGFRNRCASRCDSPVPSISMRAEPRFQTEASTIGLKPTADWRILGTASNDA